MSASRAVKKLESALEEGEHYEALQLYKALISRAVNAKKWERAIDLLEGGIRAMTKHGLSTAALDLAKLLLQTIATRDATLDSALKNSNKTEGGDSNEGESDIDTSHRHTDVVELFLNTFHQLKRNKETPSCFIFMANAIAHTSKWPHCPRGEVPLHEAAAEEHAARHSFAPSMRHTIVTGDTSRAADILIAWIENSAKIESENGDRVNVADSSSSKVESEVGLFVARSTLQFLCAWDAPELGSEFVSACVSKSKGASRSIAEQMEKDPLINFAKLIAEGASYGSPELFRKLKDTYAPWLERDPEMEPFLESVAEIHFGIRAEKPQSLMTFMNSILEGFAEGGDQ